MTNGEKIVNTFHGKVSKTDGVVYFSTDGWIHAYDDEWWNSEYKEPTTNDLGVDCISRESVLELLNDYRDKHFENRKEYPVNYGTLLDILRWIRNLPSVTPQEPRWIPVSERLPEDNKTYLVTIELTFDRNQRYVSQEIRNNWNSLKRCSHEVIAWMPLPEPYKAESEEDVNE